MFGKLLVFVFFLVPVMAFGQDNPSVNSNYEFIVNGLTKSDKVDHVDRFFSVELRAGLNDPKMVFSPGVEFEYLEDSASGENILLKRYSRLFWVKGYYTFRPEKRLKPYLGGAMGLDSETIKYSSPANGHETVVRDSSGFVMDLLAGVHFYPHNRIVLTVSSKLWRPSLNFGAGFTF